MGVGPPPVEANVGKGTKKQTSILRNSTSLVQKAKLKAPNLTFDIVVGFPLDPQPQHRPQPPSKNLLQLVVLHLPQPRTGSPEVEIIATHCTVRGAVASWYQNFYIAAHPGGGINRGDFYAINGRMGGVKNKIVQPSSKVSVISYWF